MARAATNTCYRAPTPSTSPCGSPTGRSRSSARSVLTWLPFGADPAKVGARRTVDKFRTKCLRELEKIQRAWPDLHDQTVTGGLVVSPSPPRIAPSQLRLVDAGRP